MSRISTSRNNSRNNSRNSSMKKFMKNYGDDEEVKKEEKIAKEIKRQKTVRQHIINEKRQEQSHRNKIITESISHAIDAWEQNLRNRSNQSRFSINPFFFNIENVAKDYYQQHRPNDTNIPTFNTSFLKQKKQRGEEQSYRQQQQEQQQKERYRKQQEQQEEQEQQEIYRQQQEEKQEQQEERYRQQQQRREDEAHRNKIITESIYHAINAWEQNLRNRSNQSRFGFISPIFFDVKKVAIDYYKQRRPNDTNIPDFYIIDNIIAQRQQEQRQRQQEQRQEMPTRGEQQQPREQQPREQQPREQIPPPPVPGEYYVPTPSDLPDCPSSGREPPEIKTQAQYDQYKANAKQLFLIFHPDKNTKCSQDATEKFKKLQANKDEFLSLHPQRGGRKKSTKNKSKNQKKHNKTKKLIKK
jgi:hypothetical protein